MTSIEFLRKRLPSLFEHDENNFYTNLFNEADEMHKEEIEDSFQDGKWDWAEHITNGTESKDLAQYYQEKFKNG
jgi:hypothetical protein